MSSTLDFPPPIAACDRYPHCASLQLNRHFRGGTRPVSSPFRVWVGGSRSGQWRRLGPAAGSSGLVMFHVATGSLRTDKALAEQDLPGLLGLARVLVGARPFVTTHR